MTALFVAPCNDVWFEILTGLAHEFRELGAFALTCRAAYRLVNSHNRSVLRRFCHRKAEQGDLKGRQATFCFFRVKLAEAAKSDVARKRLSSSARETEEDDALLYDIVRHPMCLEVLKNSVSDSSINKSLLPAALARGYVRTVYSSWSGRAPR